jgi:outer membrane immunogenic protein
VELNDKSGFLSCSGLSEGEMRNSKLIISAAVAISAIVGVGAASAADVAPRYTKAPPIAPVVVYDWSGFYVGINGGGGSSRKCWDLISVTGTARPLFAEGCSNATGGTVGGQVGYRWQRAAWVFGFEAQGNWADFSGSNLSNNLTFATPYTNRSRIDALGMFTGQVGYAWNTFLLYVKGGAAFTRDKYDAYTNGVFGLFPVGTAFDQASETRWGGAIGIGGEYAFSPNWSLGLEYDHLFMGTRTLTMTAVGNLGIPVGTISRGDNIHQDVDMFTARINYKFGGPVVAKY